MVFDDHTQAEPFTCLCIGWRIDRGTIDGLKGEIAKINDDSRIAKDVKSELKEE